MRSAKYFVSIIMFLILLGLLFIYSATSVCSLEQHATSYYFLKRQLIGLSIGVSAGIILMLMPMGYIRSLAPLLLLSSIGMVLLSLSGSWGIRINGASRWIRLGPLLLQPAELLKISWLICAADYIDRHERNFLVSTWGYTALLGLSIVCCCLLLKQPDFGNAVLLMSVGILLFFIAQLPLKKLALIVSGIVPLVVLLIVYKPYRLRRVIGFLNPWHDPQGTGFQIIQSLIALGVGGWTGLGIGQSKQKLFYLPMHYTDFIFSIIVEEIGFLGGISIITLYGLVFIIGLRYAVSLRTTFDRLFCTGGTLLISLQAVFHMGVSMGLLPPKGIGLPFISYGSSSLVGLLCLVSLMLNCAKNTTKRFHFSKIT